MSHFFSSPYWRDVRDALARAPADLRGSLQTVTGQIHLPSPLRLLEDRLQCVRIAVQESGDLAARSLARRFADLGLQDIVGPLLQTLQEAVLIVGASTAVGAGLGAGAGFFLGAGAGAVPGALAGGALGAQVGGWILAALGLADLADFFLDGLPALLGTYRQGFTTAWQAGHDPMQGPGSGSPGAAQDRRWRLDIAAGELARGHEAVVVLLLGAVAAYLTRGRSAEALATRMRAGRLGEPFAAWMLSQQGRLKTHPDLQPRPREQGAVALPSASTSLPSPSKGPSNKGEVTATKVSTSASFSNKQLDKKFKHAEDFGISTIKKNPETLARYKLALESHLNDSATFRHGTYQYIPNSSVHFSPLTNNVIVLGPSDEFVTGWKLTPDTPQFNNYLKNGVLR